EIGNDNVAIKSHHFLTNLLLQSYSSGNGNHHHYNTYSNGCNTNFYYWCRNTTFIRFTVNNAFGYKIFKFQMMQLKFILFKNTVLLFVFILISCGNFSSAKNEKSPTKIDKEIASSQVNSNDSQIVVGANQTEKYMPLIQGKRVGIVANLTSVIFKNEAQTTYTHLVDSLLALQMDLRKVFSPEHGFRGNVDAGEFVESGKDTKT